MLTIVAISELRKLASCPKGRMIGNGWVSVRIPIIMPSRNIPASPNFRISIEASKDKEKLESNLP
ncbi:hypothetical protein HanXRQr2_Chr06g0238391 [Helianthus annuus]|uniref:Uncharacterized protein n=1 Tax=Helianthus annuus TaxID=4232 RepID=A0A9K3IPB0_HELAN|nr:hypothetical protein HanXRQr2_Chr06g0238391 [Helianthus annuus]KAJ0913667.1 hypothetical protein HanPSC8_Chr06g0229961 [Helianthus annuus]